MSNPYGHVCHFGDCRIFCAQVCTCGLLMDLIWLPDPESIYPKFYEEIDRHDYLIRHLMDTPSDYVPPTKEDKKTATEMFERIFGPSR